MALGTWNDYLMSSLFLTKMETRTLAIATQTFLSNHTAEYAPMMAGLLLGIIPVLAFLLNRAKIYYRRCCCRKCKRLTFVINRGQKRLGVHPYSFLNVLIKDLVLGKPLLNAHLDKFWCPFPNS